MRTIAQGRCGEGDAAGAEKHEDLGSPAHQGDRRGRAALPLRRQAHHPHLHPRRLQGKVTIVPHAAGVNDDASTVPDAVER